ncbi:hypothetical protein [Pseudarthrobacter sp. ATCC 49987]|uniref:hypothetical protein n=1 Tax=Pseudarthrobacter sp. ATCC 49987 TaxID=2698204 RepID=UPI00136BB222|nr:hypothetical protein [Pseudarthrobacter sp. ATCC 49987]
MAVKIPIDMMVSEVTDQNLAGILKLLQVADPPAMVRLEPDSITGDPAPGAEARIGDAAWMLGRQWQFGELTGEDAGSVVSVHVASSALPITAWAPLSGDSIDMAGADWRPWREGALLEELIQDVPELAFGDGVRQRAEAGAQLVDLLADAGEETLARSLTVRHPLALDDDPNDPLGLDDPQAARLFAVLGGAVPDGGTLAGELRAGDPDWIGEAMDAAAARAAIAEWLAWLGGEPDSGGAWSTERLEYRFALRFGDKTNAVFARGTQFGSASVRWSDLEWVEGASVELPGEAPSGTPVGSEATMLATPLRFPGMPADRYWQLEDGAVDVGAIEAQTNDLARLCLAEFALSSGDDWLVVPVDGLLGAVNRVGTVTLTDDFGDAVTVPELDDPAFTMFGVTSAAGRMLPGIVLPPVAVGTLVGEALEDVLFLRDEMANMAWAIENSVQGRSGDPRRRASERPPAPDPWPEGLSQEERAYRLQSPVPAHWIPLAPVALTPGRVSLRKAALLHDGVPVVPRGITLRPTPLTFPGEELPREGLHLRAVPVLARRADGRYARWAAYRVRTGRGEASSRLAWDSALSFTDMTHPPTA